MWSDNRYYNPMVCGLGGMASNRDKTSEQGILLGLLEAVERGDVTQRSLARELGIAVGLVNTYVKRCVTKGLIKVRHIPSRRYGYYLTPKGFLEKSQLIASYFVHSFDFFRRARTSCEAVLSSAATAGHRRIGLAGASELAEIAVIVATEIDVEIVTIIDGSTKKLRILGLPVTETFAAAANSVDAVVITNLSDPQVTYEAAISVFGGKRVYMPSVLANIVTRADRPLGTPKRRAQND
jgi:DNA-binding MarR family transcriptional regulator